MNNQELEEWNKRISDAQIEHHRLTEEQNGLTNNINQLIAQKAELEGFINSHQEISDQLPLIKLQIVSLENSKEELQTSKNKLETEISIDNENLKNIKNDITKTQTELKLCKDEYKLYSSDLGGVSKGSSRIAREYTIYVFVITIVLGCIFWYYLNTAVNTNPLLDLVFTYFERNKPLALTYLLVYRTSFLGAVLFLVVVLLRFLKGFIAVIIKNNKTMESIRLLDFLVSRIDTQHISNPETTESIEFNKQLLKEKIDILSKYIPDLIKHDEIFDKVKIETKEIDGEKK